MPQSKSRKHPTASGVRRTRSASEMLFPSTPIRSVTSWMCGEQNVPTTGVSRGAEPEAARRDCRRSSATLPLPLVPAMWMILGL
eukprot:scaffold1428_cov259-Pinguiococcus_pyrenoidosus.AAC.10